LKTVEQKQFHAWTLFLNPTGTPAPFQRKGKSDRAKWFYCLKCHNGTTPMRDGKRLKFFPLCSSENVRMVGSKLSRHNSVCWSEGVKSNVTAEPANKPANTKRANNNASSGGEVVPAAGTTSGSGQSKKRSKTMEQKAEDDKKKAAKKMKYLITHGICWKVDQACEHILQSPARELLMDFLDSSTKKMKGGLMNKLKIAKASTFSAQSHCCMRRQDTTLLQC
jgi:hypothetical protein